MVFKKRIELELRHKQQLMDNCRSMLDELPQGMLSSKIVKGKRYYSYSSKGKTHYIGDASHELVSKLTDRRAVEELVSRLDNNIRSLKEFYEAFKDIDLGRIVASLGPNNQLVSDSLYKKLEIVDTREWDELNHNMRGFYDEGRIHKNRDGVRMRSRVEVGIGDIYSFKNIKALYEQPLQLKTGRIIHPDFTVYVESEHRVKYHEHCGMMDDPKYRDDFAAKLLDYLNEGLMPMQDVLFTFDKDGINIDMEEIETLIDMYMA